MEARTTVIREQAHVTTLQDVRPDIEEKTVDSVMIRIMAYSRNVNVSFYYICTVFPHIRPSLKNYPHF